MPGGSYLVGGTLHERFTCAPGPAGWRYSAYRTDEATDSPRGRLDLTLDDAGRPVRLLAEVGGVSLRGGASGPDVLWRRDEVEHAAPAAGFTGSSPAFLVATARLLRLGVGERRRVALVRLDDTSLGALTVEEGWTRTDTKTLDGLVIDRYEVADLATGARRVVHLMGEVVMSVEGDPTVALVGLSGRPATGGP